MKNFQICLLLVLSSIFLISCQRDSVVELELNENWMFKSSVDTTWLKASIPGSVHTDLLENKKIEDPYFGENEQELQWIEKSDWDYKSTFFVDDDMLANDKVEIVFKGLDTYADVYLNDSLILSADNMFREWEVDCKEKLRIGKNNLFIKFWSPVKIDSIKATEVPYQLPDIRGFTRKAPYQYGWDWGPRLVTSGIWKPVYLKCWNEFRINDVQVIQKELTAEFANISAIIEIDAVKDGSVELIVVDNNSNQELGKYTNEFKPGSNYLTIDFTINNPKLWWTNGLGKGYLYDLKFLAKSKKSVDEVDQKIGLRTLKLVESPDSIGSSFYFELNGVPVFMKGANYIPQDNFPARVTDEKYKQTIQTAVDANMNMLRVWGGGFYEKDIFYDLCDENGILVWQDFMFACNMYPGDEKFIGNIKQEAIENVKRLRNHPCLALWCGNNEVDEGWHNWGWQKALNYSKEDSTEVWNNYLKIFEDILPSTILTYSPYIPYVPSSPKIGWGHKEALTEGDMHYWGVWWGEEPFEVYEEKVGRFMTEYGFQGFPDLKTLDSCLLPKDLNITSPVLKNHQKHPRGMELIQMYMEREFNVPNNFEDYAYVSQLVQAYGIKTALEAHRRAKPYCMGTLYWQLNDCWPVISWSSVDYYNRWKALHYFTREAFKNLTLSFERENKEVKVYIISDMTGSYSTNLSLELIDFLGVSYWKKVLPFSIKSNSSSVYYIFNLNNIADSISHDNLILNAKLISESGYVNEEKHCFFNRPKNLKLVNPNITYKTRQDQYGHYISVKTENLAKNICLSIDKDGHFSDNYFDLLPGDSINVQFYSPKDEALKAFQIENFKDRIKLKSLFDTL